MQEYEKKIITYGSLKKGRYNHSILENSKFLGDTTVKGTMYSLGAYPAMIDEGDNEYPAEIYEVEDAIYNNITQMELGAGYKIVETEQGVIYYAGDNLKARCKEFYRKITSY